MFKFLSYIPPIIMMLTAMDAVPTNEVATDNYQRYLTKDSSIIEVLDYGDSALVVQTVCAPICSSTARVYKNNDVIRTIKPTVNGVFPYAWIEDGKLYWRDNTVEMLDDEEKKR